MIDLDENEMELTYESRRGDRRQRQLQPRKEYEQAAQHPCLGTGVHSLVPEIYYSFVLESSPMNVSYR